MISKFPQLELFLQFFFLFCWMCVLCVCFSYILPIFWRLWFRHYKMAQDTTEDYFLNVVEVRGAPAGDLFFTEPALHCSSMRRGSHKRLMKGRERRREGEEEGEEVRGQGQMSWIQREKHIAFHQAAEKEVIHNSVDTIWPWMLGVRCSHAATGRQVKKRKKYHSLFPPNYLTAQKRKRD